MKNAFKTFGNLNQDRRSKVPLLIVALVAIIGFSFIACEEEKDDDKGGDGRISGWPNSTVLSSYGINGLTQPADATNVIYFVKDDSNLGFSDGKKHTSLTVYFTGTETSLNTIRTWFNNQSDWSKHGTQYNKHSGNVDYIGSPDFTYSTVEGRNCYLLISKAE